MSNTNPLYRSPLDCIKKIVASDGIFGLFRGMRVLLMRDVYSYGLYFVSYEHMKRTVLAKTDKSEMDHVMSLLAGGLAGTFAWFSCYPIDVVKTRLQTSTTYSGIVDCFTRSFREEGIKVFFKGLTPALMRSFPVNATIFYVYELAAKILKVEK